MYKRQDYDFKVKNAKKFIAKGDKVKFTIRFKGRELQHSHLGNELMGKIKEDMKDIPDWINEMYNQGSYIFYLVENGKKYF